MKDFAAVLSIVFGVIFIVSTIFLSRKVNINKNPEFIMFVVYVGGGGLALILVGLGILFIFPRYNVQP
jgi:hypothetical protein